MGNFFVKKFGIAFVLCTLATVLAFAGPVELKQDYVGLDSKGQSCTVHVYRSGGEVQSIEVNSSSVSYDPNTSSLFTCEHVRKSDGNDVSVRTWEGEDLDMWYQEASLKYSDATQALLVEASYRISRRANKFTPDIACLSLLAASQQTCKVTGTAN